MRKLLFFAAVTVACAADFPASRFGAKGDGKTADTAAIQRALDAAAKRHGTVTFGRGVYLTGALFLKSGTRLRVDEGVTLRGVQDINAYPMLDTRVSGIEMKWPAALINVYEQSDVTVSGPGTIDGDGKPFWDLYWKMRREDYEPKGLRWAVDYDCRRPRLIQVYKSENIALSGLHLERSGFWTVHLCYSAKVTVDGLTIRNNIGGRGPSTDGIDIDSSRDVTVSHCDIECNDDALCLKAGRDADGLRVNRPSEHIVLRDNTVRDGAAGVTFGSETSGWIRDVQVDGLTVMSAVPAGILFKSASTRGGGVENVSIRRVSMEGVRTPVSITMNWNPAFSYATAPAGVTVGMGEMPSYWKTLLQPVSPEKGLPHIRGVRIEDVKAAGARQAFAVSAYPEALLEDFTFRKLDIAAQTAGSIRNAVNWTIKDSKIVTADGTAVEVHR